MESNYVDIHLTSGKLVSVEYNDFEKIKGVFDDLENGENVKPLAEVNLIDTVEVSPIGKVMLNVNNIEYYKL